MMLCKVGILLNMRSAQEGICQYISSDGYGYATTAGLSKLFEIVEVCVTMADAARWGLLVKEAALRIKFQLLLWWRYDKVCETQSSSVGQCTDKRQVMLIHSVPLTKDVFLLTTVDQLRRMSRYWCEFPGGTSSKAHILYTQFRKQYWSWCSRLGTWQHSTAEKTDAVFISGLLGKGLCRAVR